MHYKKSEQYEFLLSFRVEYKNHFLFSFEKVICFLVTVTIVFLFF